MARPSMSPGRRLTFLLSLLFAFVLAVTAQSTSTSTSSSPTSSQSSTSFSQTTYLTTSFVSSTITSTSGGSRVLVPTSVPTTFNVTSTIIPTSTTSSNSSATSTSTATATATPITLATVLDPAFGVLGGILIITGLPSAFLGHKNRWSSFFLIGFYTLSLVCFVLILKFGILTAVNPPSKTLRGMFVLASGVAGIAGGGVAIFFWKATRFFIGGWGGFAFALWIECFRDGGLIHPIAFRWIFYIGCGVVGFVLCTIQKIHYHVVLISTGLVGSTAVILGVDCFTAANLKEFYIWNLGFTSLFPKYVNNGIQFPVSQTMQIELGLIGAICLMGIAVQFRILKLLQRKLNEIEEERRRREAENDSKEAERFSRLPQELAEWEKDHPTGGKHWRQNSEFSGLPLMHAAGGDPEPGTPVSGMDEREPMFARNRNLSEGSNLMLAQPTRAQSPGAILTLDLGLDLQSDVPKDFMTDAADTKEGSSADSEALRKKAELEAEIGTLRRSLDMLGEQASSSGSRSRIPSLTSRRTLSYDLNTATLPPSHIRPPRGNGAARDRTYSMELGTLATANSVGNSIGRPTSAPLRDDWDSYVRDRKILQPPAGASAPIATTPVPVLSPAPRISVPPAVHEALRRREQQEVLLDGGDPQQILRADSSSPYEGEFGDRTSRHLGVKTHHHQRTSSSKDIDRYASGANVTVLPPAKKPSPPNSPSNMHRTVTYEELTERHREKMRQLQAPLTQAEKEQAELEAAKARWERSKAAEKQAVMKRQAEQAKASERKHRDDGRSRSRTLSGGNRLDAVGARPVSSTKRLSTMKVEDWQKYQSEVEPQQRPAAGGRRQSGVPFPADQPQRRRHSRGPSAAMPPN